jgi:hypothetical protein
MGHDDDYKEEPEAKQISPLQRSVGEAAEEEEIDLTAEVSEEESPPQPIQYVPFPVILQAPGELQTSSYFLPIAPAPKDDSFQQKLFYEFLIIGALVASRYFF